MRIVFVDNISRPIYLIHLGACALTAQTVETPSGDETMIYIENRTSLAILTEALNLAAKPQSWLEQEIREHLVKVKAARRIQRGDARDFKRLSDLVVGLWAQQFVKS